jgi:hypothetical protein
MLNWLFFSSKKKTERKEKERESERVRKEKKKGQVIDFPESGTQCTEFPISKKEE